MTKIYYKPPSDECFENMRSAALTTWSKYKKEPTYYEEKTSRLKVIGNVGDNFMYIFASFDDRNQQECASYLTDETKHQVMLRMIDGGNPTSLIEDTLGVPFEEVVKGIVELDAL